MAKKTGKILPSSDISVFCLQLALILKSGLPIFEGLKILSDSETDDNDGGIGKNKRLLRIVGSLADDVEKGEPLYSAMAKTPYFPEYLVNMVEVGEVSGKLDSILESLGDYYEREQYLKVKIRNTLMYPIFLFCIMSVVVALLVVKVFPVFNDMLNSMGGSLSDTTQGITAFANSLAASRIIMIIILVAAALIIFLYVFSKTSAGSKLFDLLLYAFPITRNINKKIAASRFSNVLSIAISSGLDMKKALELALNMIENDILKDKFKQCIENIDGGMNFVDSIADIKIYKPLYIKFMEIGQRTGNIDTVMKKISDLCENEADNAIGGATAFIEPVLIGVLSGIIGIILVSVMLPLVQIMSSIA